MKLQGLTLSYPAPFLIGQGKYEDPSSLLFRLVTEDGWERSYTVYGPFFHLTLITTLLAEEKIEEACKMLENMKAKGELTDGKP